VDFSPDNRLLLRQVKMAALWDANAGEHLLTMISLDDGGEWMVVTTRFI
jgi:hypothetical protein